MSATKKIYLTPTERASAAKAAQEAIDKGKRHHGVVIAVIAAINQDRKDCRAINHTDLLDAARYVRYWSEADNCDDTPANLAHLHNLADRLEAAAKKRDDQ